jgi:glycerophosphoryl diester phosphodiesterase
MMSVQLQYCCYEDKQKKPNYLRILALGLVKALRSVFSGNVFLPLFSLLLYIMMNVPVVASLILHLDLKGQLPAGYPDAIFVKGLFLLLLALLCFIAFRGMFALHFCLHDRVGFTKGLEASKGLLKGHGLRIFLTLALTNIVLSLLLYLLYFSILFIVALLVYILAEKNLVISVFLSYYPKVTTYYNIFSSVFCFVINFNIISTFFCRYQVLPVSAHKSTLAESEEPDPLRSSFSKRIALLILLALSSAGLLNLYLNVRNDSYSLKEALIGIQITSHRGNSATAPENTLASLESAIEAMADYAEIDVQQTKDGTLVLLHDYNLRRTTGLNKYIWDVSYEELKELDAGSWFDEQFTGVTIPTLEEALELCKGKIQLNIELKVHGSEKNLEEQLVSLIEEYDFENQCVISSGNLRVLAKIKELKDELHTGYIITAAYGSIYNRAELDFISMKSSFITKSTVETAHRAGKAIHAWTVNSEREMERMKSLGVDNIITDNPYLAKEVLYRDNTNDSLIEFLDRMLSGRSFFRIAKKK